MHKNSAMQKQIFAAILLTAAVMRSPMTAVGPVLQVIRQEYALSNAAAGSITTVPMLLFMLVSLSAPLILRRISPGNMQTISAGLICMGLLLRSFSGLFGLYAGTAFIGLGVGMYNVLIPRAIKQDFPGRVEQLTGLYFAVMAFFAAMGAGLSVPLSGAIGWRGMLCAFLPFAVAASVIWLLFQRKAATELPVKTNAAPSDGGGQADTLQILVLLRNKMAWKITLCMGAQSAFYFCVVAWLPTFLQQRGMDAARAGYANLVVQIAGMVSAYGITQMMRRIQDQRKCLIPAASLLIIGCASLFFHMGGFLRYILLVCLGLGIGTGLSYTVTILSLRANTPAQVVTLSAMAQTGGYIIAALGPVLLGALYDRYQSLEIQLCVLLLLGLGYLIFGTMVALRPGKHRGLE